MELHDGLSGLPDPCRILLQIRLPGRSYDFRSAHLPQLPETFYLPHASFGPSHGRVHAETGTGPGQEQLNASQDHGQDASGNGDSVQRA
eukprot:3453384-Rhodomonas_salina.1